jgi:NADPH-dependent 2,4-dienoyl-CoA reductase/sulfur reductase-like enzyme
VAGASRPGGGRVVVVGGSLGGLRAAESLRSAGFAGRLTVVSEEPWFPYNRPPLSKEALRAGVEHATLEFRRRESVADVEWRLGSRAVASDLAERTVTLDDGEVVSWDGLVAATGLRPRRLPVPGPPPLAAADRYVLRTLDDAVALRERVRPGTRVVVAGAGFIGCEVAATARALSCDVVNVAVDARPMIRPLGELLAAELQRRLERRGLAFRLGVGIERFLGEDRVEGVRLSDGTELPADVVVEAVGSRCNTEWLDGNGLDLTDGVLADGALRMLRVDGTPVDGAHVVGDLARFPYPIVDDAPRRIEHWSLPTDTGRRVGPVLAAWLAGDVAAYAEVVARPFSPIPSFWSDLFEMRLQSFGLPDAGEEVRVLEGDLDGVHDGPVVVGYLRGDVLVGVVALDATKQAMPYRARLGRPEHPGRPESTTPVRQSP